jgi:uncharacterized cupredoxin-like copper-binding protein
VRSPGLRAVAVIASCIAAGIAGVVAYAATSKPITVRVDAKDFGFALSRRSVPAGTTVRFVVRNRGAVAHDFVIGGRRTGVLAHGKSQTIVVRFPKKGHSGFSARFPAMQGWA